MSGNSWGESWGITGSFAWGDSLGFEGAVIPPSPPPPPPPSTTEVSGVGRVGGFSKAWRDHYRKTLPKKKRKLLDSLDEAILELRERIAEAPPRIDTDAYERELRVSQALADRRDFSAIEDSFRIAERIDALKQIIQEIDDEETLLLAVFH